MRTQIPVPLMYPVLYAVVLAAGLYSQSVGLGDVALLPFVGALAALAVVDGVEWRRFPAGAPFPLAVGLLLLRAVLYVVVCISEPTGIARVLLLLLPFRAHLLFGRVAAVAIGALLLAATVVTSQVTTPGWMTSAEKINDLVMFIVGLVLTLAIAAVAAEERAGRERLRLAAAAAERVRVGREIHDGLGHHLTAISVLLAKASAFRTIDAHVADEAISDAQEASRLALTDVRRSVRTLSESEPFDLADAVRALGRGLPVHVDITGEAAGYDDGRRLAIYRSAQEAVTNALRHASATSIDVQLALGASDAVVTVHDDGTGFEPSRTGRGLTGLRHRIEGMGGSLLIESGPDVGTTVAVTVPRASA